jgi:hypothetical protein
MATSEPLVDFVALTGDRVLLRTPEELQRFVNREVSFWSDLGKNASGRAPFNVPLQVVSNLANQLQAMARDDSHDAAQDLFSRTYSAPEIAIPLSTSQTGIALQDISQRFGYQGAAGALTLALPEQLYGEPFAGVNRAAFNGAVEFISFRAGLSSNAIEAARRTLNGLHGRATQVTADIQLKADEQLEKHATEFSSAAEKIETRISARERAMLESQLRYDQAATEALASFAATHATYLEQMKLRAPVEYWRTKAAEHKRDAGDLRNWLVGFFVLMIGGYVIAIVGLHDQLAEFLLKFQGNTGALLIVSASFALLASLPLWVGRLLVKFYLSEHHLATDAKEREVMTQTYLALTAEGAVDEKDRTLILSALFRSTPDGVVKDNSQPDTSPGAMLSKLLDSR